MAEAPVTSRVGRQGDALGPGVGLPGRPVDEAAAEAEALRVRLRSAAHEIRTPLTGAAAVADILAASDLPAATSGYVDLLRQALAQIVAVANDILDVGRIEAEHDLGVDEVFSPLRLLDAVVGLARPRAEAKGLSLLLTAPELPPFLAGPPVMLRRAVENLVDNALKHTGAGSIAVTARWTGSTLDIAVSDTGIGIADADLPRLFQPYAQLASGQRAGGTGLGLALVKGAVERMGGTVAVSRTDEGGARFALSVPLATAAAPPPPPTPTAGETRPLTILVAEDNPVNRLVSGTLLREFGHRVSFASDGAAAVAEAARGGYDVVLMDLELPGLDGSAALRGIRALPLPATPVIAVSARGEDARAGSLAEGFDGYVSKPIDPAALHRALAAVAG